jgi:hypothetical protein
VEYVPTLPKSIKSTTPAVLSSLTPNGYDTAAEIPRRPTRPWSEDTGSSTSSTEIKAKGSLVVSIRLQFYVRESNFKAYLDGVHVMVPGAHLGRQRVRHSELLRQRGPTVDGARHQDPGPLPFALRSRCSTACPTLSGMLVALAERPAPAYLLFLRGWEDDSNRGGLSCHIVLWDRPLQRMVLLKFFGWWENEKKLAVDLA